MGYMRLPSEVIEELLTDYDIYQTVIRPKGYQYVDVSVKGRYGGLLWIEVFSIQHKVKMSRDEKLAFGTYLAGYNNKLGASRRKWDIDFYQDVLNSALFKANRYKHTGVITTILEELGWQAKSYSETLDSTANVEPKYGTWSRVSKKQQHTSAGRVSSNRSTGRYKGRVALHSAGTAVRN